MTFVNLECDFGLPCAIFCLAIRDPIARKVFDKIEKDQSGRITNPNQVALVMTKIITTHRPEINNPIVCGFHTGGGLNWLKIQVISSSLEPNQIGMTWPEYLLVKCSGCRGNIEVDRLHSRSYYHVPDKEDGCKVLSFCTEDCFHRWEERQNVLRTQRS